MGDRREPYNPLLKSYPDSEKVNAVTEGAETLFTRLIAQSDDLNHYHGEAAMVLGKLYTRRMCAGQVNQKEIQRRIDELANARLIEIYDADGRLYIEIVNCRKDLRADAKLDIRFPKRPENSSGPDTARIRPVTVPLTEPNRTEPNPPEKTVPPPLPGAGSLPPGFVRFWETYPRCFRKQGRAKCVAHWRKAKLEPLADSIVAVLAKCKASPDWTKEDGQFIPFPMTWLNRTPWETELAELSEKRDPGASASKARAESADKMKAAGELRREVDAERDRTIATLKALPADRMAELKRQCVEAADPKFRAMMEKADPLSGGMLGLMMVSRMKAESLAGAT